MVRANELIEGRYYKAVYRSGNIYRGKAINSFTVELISENDKLVDSPKTGTVRMASEITEIPKDEAYLIKTMNNRGAKSLLSGEDF